MRLAALRPLLALSLAVGAPSLAAAQSRPPAMPSRDVVVAYQVENAGPTVDTVAWLVAEGRIRTDGKGFSNRVTHLIDTRGGGVVAYVDATRSYQDLGRMAEVMTQDIVLARPASRLVREGADTVAGHQCTVWRIDGEGGSSPDEARRACITADGVPLRLVEGTGADASTLYVATRVTYGAQDPARFRVPDGYQPLSAGTPARRR